MGGKIKIFTTEVTEGTQRVSQSRMRLMRRVLAILAETKVPRFARDDTRESTSFFLEQLGCEIRKRLW